jgi:hypothetical protein
MPQGFNFRQAARRFEMMVGSEGRENRLPYKEDPETKGTTAAVFVLREDEAGRLKLTGESPPQKPDNNQT